MSIQGFHRNSRNRRYAKSSNEVFPAGLAPVIRLAPDGTESGEQVRTAAAGIFRFVPVFIAKVEWVRNPLNARLETVDGKSAYKKAWAEDHVSPNGDMFNRSAQAESFNVANMILLVSTPN